MFEGGLVKGSAIDHELVGCLDEDVALGTVVLLGELVCR